MTFVRGALAGMAALQKGGVSNLGLITEAPQ